MNKILAFSGVAAWALMAACSQPTQVNTDDQDPDLKVINADSLGKHIEVLSSDDFMGRKPFTAGETKTIEYLQAQFKQIGLEPGNGDSYYQDVPLTEITTKGADSMMVESPKGKFALKGFDDYAIWTQRTEPKVSLDKDELVFAGFGIVAPELGWNDYAGIDVKGKVVLVMVNDPDFGTQDSSLFKGRTMTYYGRWTYKFEEAARQGAKGCLIIHNTAAASYAFNVVQNNWNSARLNLATSDYQCAVVGWVTAPATQKLFEAAGLDTALMQKAKQKGFKPVPMGLKLTTSVQVKVKKDMSHNVIAKITGSKRPNEYIIYSAHWDHLGVGTPDATGDSIYNGAVDNASGTAGLLELARAFKNMKEKPERTIVFLAVTSEEQGLLGAAWYAAHPVYPAAQTVANINMDCLNVYGKSKDLIVVGQGQSELEDILKEEAEKAGRYLTAETHPEAGSYFRSDHFNFAKAGIPALYVENGIDLVDGGKSEGEKFSKEYNEKHYHQPSDEYDPEHWKMDGAIEDLKLFFKVGKHLSQSDKWPAWKSGSEFKAIRDKQQHH
ncbi:MAG: family metallo-hydrolase [Sphingobacteriaceae bacterium]|jgi:Zn-dependent M28 family amino/carboxypeptidase|nr:family metallo-hydrolase [Sphingobacteriaceae bacterium]